MNRFNRAILRFINFEMIKSHLIIIYLATYLFLPYAPSKFFKIAPHTIILFVFLILSLISINKPSLINIRDNMPLKNQLALFLILFLISALIVNNQFLSVEILRAYLFNFACFIFIVFCGINCYELTDRHLIYLCMWFSILSGILILFQVFTSYNLYISYYLTGSEKFTFGLGFGNSPSIEGVLLVWSILIVSLGFYSKRIEKNKILIVYSAIILGALGIFYTLSRAAILSLLISYLVFFLKIRMENKKVFDFKIKLVLSLIFLCFVLVMPSRLTHYIDVKVNGNLNNPSYSNFEKTPKDFDLFKPVFNDFSVNTRLFGLYVTKQILTKKFLWGCGLGCFPKEYEKIYNDFPKSVTQRLDYRSQMTPHNSFIQMLVEIGFIPSAVFFYIYFLAMYRGLKSNLDSGYFKYSLGLLGISIWMFSHDLFTDRFFWIAFGFTFLFYYSSKDKKT